MVYIPGLEAEIHCLSLVHIFYNNNTAKANNNSVTGTEARIFAANSDSSMAADGLRYYVISIN